AFNIQSGGMMCPACRPPGSAAPSPLTVALLGALLSGDWDTADQAASRERSEASGLIAAFLQWHLERGLRSLPLVDRTWPDHSHQRAQNL
ncbi:MAG: DNA repair protein RecO, partial [Candidatus Nanopelagicales bacterium]